MFNLGMGEITVILLLALIFLGPSKLPELATGLGRIIRQIRKATADVKNEIVLDDSFRKPFEELRDAVTLHPDELKRRDQIKENAEKLRRELEELERQRAAESVPADATAATSPFDEGGGTPPPVVAPVPPPPVVAAAPPAPPAPSPPAATFLGAPPVGTFPRTPTPPPFGQGRLGGGQRITPPISSLDGNAANITQVLAEEDLLPAAKRNAPPPLPPPLPGVAPPPPPPRSKKG